MEKLENLSDCEPDSSARVRVVPDVADVPVPLLLWSLSFVMFLPVALIGKMLYRSPLLSPESEHIVVQVRKKR